MSLAVALLAAPGLSAGVNQWTRLGQDTGAVTALALDPRNAGTAYASTGGALFRTADAGATWTAMSSAPPCCVSTLLIDPQNPATIYAMSGAAGIFRSADGGASWSAVNSGLPVDDKGSYGVTSLAMDPRDPNTLYAGIGRAGGGVFKTTNAAASWTFASPGLPDGAVVALALDPQKRGTIYASTRAGGVFQSTDDGATWTALNTGLGYEINHGYDYISVLAIDPQGVLYAAPQYGSAIDDSGLFVSGDSGASWYAVKSFSTYDDSTGTGFIVTAIAADPRNPGTVYAGTSAGIYRTADWGATWIAVKTRAAADAEPPFAISALAIDPLTADSVYAASPAIGILQSADAGATWMTVNSDLRETTPPSPVQLKFDLETPGTLFAPTAASGLFRSSDAGASWSATNAGLQGPVFDVRVSDLQIGRGMLYAIDPYWEDIFKSTDGGTTWKTALAVDAAGLVVRGARLIANALAVDPRNPRTLYVAGAYWQNGAQIGPIHGIYKSTDAGASWSWAGSGIPDTPDFATVRSLAVDPVNPATIYAGRFLAGFNGVYKTTNGGATWKAAGMGGTFSQVDILGIDPQHTSTVYARAITYIPGTAGCCGWLFKTTNGGDSWTAANAGLPNYVTALAIDPRNPGTLYAGTRSGIYRSVDGGGNWVAVNDGLTNLSVMSLAIDPQNSSTIYAGTAGGLFTMTFVP